MPDLGMPTLLEMPKLTDCMALRAESGLPFVERNMPLSQGVYFTLPDRRVFLQDRLRPQGICAVDENRE